MLAPEVIERSPLLRIVSSPAPPSMPTPDGHGRGSCLRGRRPGQVHGDASRLRRGGAEGGNVARVVDRIVALAAGDAHGQSLRDVFRLGVRIPRQAHRYGGGVGIGYRGGRDAGRVQDGVVPRAAVDADGGGTGQGVLTPLVASEGSSDAADGYGYRVGVRPGGCGNRAAVLDGVVTLAAVDADCQGAGRGVHQGGRGPGQGDGDARGRRIGRGARPDGGRTGDQVASFTPGNARGRRGGRGPAVPYGIEAHARADSRHGHDDRVGVCGRSHADRAAVVDQVVARPPGDARGLSFGTGRVGRRADADAAHRHGDRRGGRGGGPGDRPAICDPVVPRSGVDAHERRLTRYPVLPDIRGAGRDARTRDRYPHAYRVRRRRPADRGLVGDAVASLAAVDADGPGPDRGVGQGGADSGPREGHVHRHGVRIGGEQDVARVGDGVVPGPAVDPHGGRGRRGPAVPDRVGGAGKPQASRGRRRPPPRRRRRWK